MRSGVAAAAAAKRAAAAGLDADADLGKGEDLFGATVVAPEEKEEEADESEDEARVDGRADVDDLAELFDTQLGLEDEDEYDTVGGLIYHRIGGVPKPGDQVHVDGLTLTDEDLAVDV
jgi:CBS domain containing-hemolysin-like protein